MLRNVSCGLFLVVAIVATGSYAYGPTEVPNAACSVNCSPQQRSSLEMSTCCRANLAGDSGVCRGGIAYCIGNPPPSPAGVFSAACSVNCGRIREEINTCCRANLIGQTGYCQAGKVYCQ